MRLVILREPRARFRGYAARRVGSAGDAAPSFTGTRRSVDIEFAPFDREAEPDATPAWGSVVEAVSLIDGLESFRVSYRVQPEESWGPGTEQKNDDLSGLPWGVQLEIETEAAIWPPLIVSFEQYEPR